MMKKCSFCNNEFAAKNGYSKFCSDLCKNKREREIVLSNRLKANHEKYANKSESKDYVQCKWCNLNFIYTFEYHTRYNSTRKLFNTPFEKEEDRINCNIGPICPTCVLYKVPIRCDDCKKYGNFNNIVYQYDFNNDFRLKHLYENCFLDRWRCDIKRHNIYDKPKNLCLNCLLDYHNSVRSEGMGWCCSFCDNEYIYLLKEQYGGATITNLLTSRGCCDDDDYY